MNWPEVVIFTFSYSKWLRTCQTWSFLVKVHWNTPWTEQKCCYSLTISQSDVNICCTCMFFNAYDSPGTYDGLYGLYNSYHYLEFYYFSFTAFHNVSSFLPDMLNLWNVSSAKLYIWCCCYQVTSIGKCLYTTVYSVPLSFSLRVFDSFSFIHLRKYGILIVSLCKALFFFPYQVLCFYLVCFILYLDLWVLFYVFHCWLSFLWCPMPSNAAVVWEEVLKVIINMG